MGYRAAIENNRAKIVEDAATHDTFEAARDKAIAYNRKDKPDNLRDWFAGMALQGLLSRRFPDKKESEEHFCKNMGGLAYAIAEEMMARKEEADGDVTVIGKR